MNPHHRTSALILGIAMIVGLSALGLLIGRGAVAVKEYERSVTAKGLSEREVAADIVIWPIVFVEAANDLNGLYESIDTGKRRIQDFLISRDILPGEITLSLPSITDKSAQQYGGGERAEFRYSALQTVTVYSSRVPLVREIMGDLVELGKSGIAFSSGDYQNQIEYIFTGLNAIKPEMIQEATAKAREVAETFVQDSNSRLGRIKQASQGQFSIEDRDKNNPHLKKIRVVTTVEYYLSD